MSPTVAFTKKLHLHPRHPPPPHHPPPLQSHQPLPLPPELFLLISDYLTIPDLNSLLQTNRTLYILLTPALHHLALSQSHQIYQKPLWLWALDHSLPTFHNLLSAGLSPTLALAAAADREQEDTVRLLLSCGADATAHPTLIYTYLRNFFPSPCHLTPLLLLLLEHGANVNTAINNTLVTPLHLAAGRRSTDLQLLKTLLERGADVNATDWAGRTPLHYALQGAGVGGIYEGRPRVEVVELLLRCGSSVENAVEALEEQDRLHGHFGRENGRVKRLLLEYGAEDSGGGGGGGWWRFPRGFLWREVVFGLSRT